MLNIILPFFPPTLSNQGNNFLLLVFGCACVGVLVLLCAFKLRLGGTGSAFGFRGRAEVGGVLMVEPLLCGLFLGGFSCYFGKNINIVYNLGLNNWFLVVF